MQPSSEVLIAAEMQARGQGMVQLNIGLDGSDAVESVGSGDEVEVIFLGAGTTRSTRGTVDQALTVVVDVTAEDLAAPILVRAGVQTLLWRAGAPTWDAGVFRVNGSAAAGVLDPQRFLFDSTNLLYATAQPVTRAPHASSFRTRQRPDAVADQADSPPSAVPGWTPPLPANTVGTRYTSTFLAPDEPLIPTATATGELLEYETHWEPLGWAFDEWIDTISLGPYEDTALSSADLLSTGRSTSRSDQESVDRARAQATSRASTEEIMNQASNATATSRGVQIGLGGINSSSAALTIDPIIALTRAVTGTFQLGFSAGRSNSNATVAADLNRRLTSGIEQASTQARHAQAASLATADHSVRDTRRMRALRNMPGDTTTNLALFSVVRLWLVRTVLARPRPVVFVPIHQQDQPFVEDDVFTHHQVLRGALLDPRLTDDLDSVATDYAVPHVPQPSEDDQQVVAFGVSYLVADPGGPKTWVELQVPTTDGESTRVISTRLAVSEEDRLVRATVPVACPLGQLTKLTLRMGGSLFRDRRVELADLSVVAQLADGTTIEVLRESKVALDRGNSRDFEFARVSLVIARDTSRTRRVLAHLNANCLYYRLALDLQRDSVSRFRSMFQHQVDGVMPIDMNPVGVAGVHLAFLAGDANKSNSNVGDPDNGGQQLPDERTSSGDDAQRVIATLIATPEGGTFMELLAGRERSAHVPCDVPRPQVVLPDKSTLHWPAVTLPEPLATSVAAAAPSPTTAPTLPTAGAPEIDPAQIKSLLDEMKTMLATTQEQVAKLADANKPTPTPPSKESTGTKGDDTTAAAEV
jgi:hypothetical protein